MKVFIFLSLLTILGGCTNRAASKNTAHQKQQSSSIVIMSAELQQLDTTATLWYLADDEIVRFFSTARQVENTEAAKIIYERYAPYSMVGKLSRYGQYFEFVVHASGVAILTGEWDSRETRFYVACDKIHKELFNNLDIWNSEGVKMLLLSQHRSSEYTSLEEFNRWCEAWRLSVTEFNSYVSISREFTSTAELYATFQNFPCRLFGYLVWKGQVCWYFLESSAPLRILNATTDEVVGLFGSMDRRGERYVFEIGIYTEMYD